jgi:azurin
LEHEAEEKAEHAGKNWVLSSASKKGHDCDFDPNSKSPLAGCRLKDPPKDNYHPYVGAAETPKIAKPDDDRELTKSRVHNYLKDWENEQKRKVEEKEAEEEAENQKKLKTLTGKAYEEFKEHLEHEAEEKAEHAGKNWVLSSASKKGHDCDFDPNSKSPLAGCRLKDPPKDNYHPYVGAAETPKIAKPDDDRELTKSRVHNYLKDWENEQKRKVEEKEAEEEAENQKKLKTLTGKAYEEFKEHLEHEAEEKAEHAGKNWVLSSASKKGHDCDFDPNSKSPLAGCRLKDPPKDNY